MVVAEAVVGDFHLCNYILLHFGKDTRLRKSTPFGTVLQFFKSYDYKIYEIHIFYKYISFLHH